MTINQTLREADQKMDKAVEVTREDFAAIRAGRAHPSMFSKLTCPCDGATRPMIAFSVVDLPAPLRPSSATTSPARASSETPSRM